MIATVNILNGSVAVLGLITGTSYGLLAVGLILVYRSSRVINFAHGEIGAFAGAVLGGLVINDHVPYYLALPLEILVGALGGIIAEVVVMRRLRNAPSIVKLVALIGYGAFLSSFALVIDATLNVNRNFPEPPFFPVITVGSLVIGRAYTAMLIMTPIIVIGLALFLKYSRFGIAVRGAASNPDAARLAGISASRMSLLSWALAGALAAYTAVLLYPAFGIGAADVFGPTLLLQALAAAVFARMTSLPVGFAAGVLLGLIEQEILFNTTTGGPDAIVLLVLILVALLIQPRPRGSRSLEPGSWLAVQAWRAPSAQLRRIPSIRFLGWETAAVAAAVAVLLGVLVNNNSAVVLTAVVAFSVIGLGLGIIGGLAGQISLGQFAIAGVGAAASYLIVKHGGDTYLAFIGAGIAAATVSVGLGIPAVRVRGLMYAVVTLAFAQACPWIFGDHWLFGNGVFPGTPKIGHFAIDNSRRYYFFALVVASIMYLLARNIWSGALGRRYRAVRDNEDNARAFTLSATRVKLEAFAFAGFISGIGGALYAESLSSVSSSTFSLDLNLTVVAMVAIGGLGMVATPILGALYLLAIPRFLPLDSAGLAASELIWVVLLLQFPGGVVQSFAPLRNAIVGFLARRSSVVKGATHQTGSPVLAPAGDLPSEDAALAANRSALPVSSLSRDHGDRADSEPATGVTRRPSDSHVDPLLVVEEVSKSYGGVAAVDSVSLTIMDGETVGIIGPNGAGKTTLFELIGGFSPADHGRIIFAGQDITRLTPERRGRLGLIRSFQDAALFPTLTVTESVELALERRMPSRIYLEIIGLGRLGGQKHRRAAELIDLMGLRGYEDNLIAELSTGTRRITEIACLLALEPRLLLLDEPSSGVAQRETESLGDLLARVKEHLGTTMVIIEHDIPLITSISDRLIAMGFGRVLATGLPDEVKADPEVVESYLGASQVALARSGDAARVVTASPSERVNPGADFEEMYKGGHSSE